MPRWPPCSTTHQRRRTKVDVRVRACVVCVVCLFHVVLCLFHLSFQPWEHSVEVHLVHLLHHGHRLGRNHQDIHIMYANTTGTRHTALGAWALDSNTTASDNTAIGYDALEANTTGY